MRVVTQNFEIGKVFRNGQSLMLGTEVPPFVGPKLMDEGLSPGSHASLVRSLQSTYRFAKASLGSFTRHFDTTAGNSVGQVVSSTHESDQNHSLTTKTGLGDIQIIRIV